MGRVVGVTSVWFFVKALDLAGVLSGGIYKIPNFGRESTVDFASVSRLHLDGWFLV